MSPRPTLVSILAEIGITRDEFCAERVYDAGLAGLVSVNAADVYCRRGPRTLKRSGSVANNKLPEKMKANWNYETKDERKAREARNIPDSVPTAFHP